MDHPFSAKGTVTADATAAPFAGTACVGPNAVTQLRDAIQRRCGAKTRHHFFRVAGCEKWENIALDRMIPETIPGALFSSLHLFFRADVADDLAAEAGLGTADYVMANRIPKPARLLLGLLPAPLAARLLLKAIEKHAWTFAGSGRCRVIPGRPAVIKIADNPLKMPGCVWHVAVFRRLFQTFVSPAAAVQQGHTLQDGTHICRFEIEW